MTMNFKRLWILRRYIHGLKTIGHRHVITVLSLLMLKAACFISQHLHLLKKMKDIKSIDWYNWLSLMSRFTFLAIKKGSGTRMFWALWTRVWYRERVPLHSIRANWQGTTVICKHTRPYVLVGRGIDSRRRANHVSIRQGVKTGRRWQHSVLLINIL